jgi:hypothetical protein
VSDSLASTPDGAGRGVAKPSRQLRLGLREGISDGWAVGSNATLADLVGSRTSGLGLFYVLMYVGLWGRYLEAHGEPPPSNRQLALAFKLAPRTVDRYRDRFDDAFPELDDPAKLLEAVHLEVTGDSPEVWAFKLGGAEL